jgi:ATP-binding cassette subfamily C exporter for protease/lipase/ATP-binding cassette subfamily C protein EexD
MNELLRPYRYVLTYAALSSFFLDLLLLTPSIYMMQVFDRVMTSRSDNTLFWLTVLAVAMLFIYFLVEWLRGRMMTSVSLLLDRLLAEKVLGVVMNDAHAPGVGRYTYLMRDVTTLRAFVGGPAFLALMEAPWLPFFILIIYLVHPVLGTISLVSAIAMFALALVNNRISSRPLEQLQLIGRKANQYIDVSMRNAEAVHAMGMFPSVVRRWSDINRQGLKIQAETGKYSALVTGLNKFGRQFVQIIMLAAGMFLVLNFHATPGVIIAATFIVGRALMPLDQLISGWQMMVNAHASYRRLDEALGGVDETVVGTRLPALQGAIQAEKITFAIKRDQPPLIRAVSFELAPGEMMGLVGPSGSGKSTLLRLLTGVWRPLAGTVRLDGNDLQHWHPEELGPQIGYLPQDIELFPGTVSENIARMAEMDSEKVIEAARGAGAHEMIQRLKDGYDTEIGPGGAVLSGGQRQRVGLARALYGNPCIVILDEPNAFLDAEGESALVTTLRQLRAANVTIIVVTHKPSLLVDADKLLVLRDGAVAAFGPRQEVLAKLGMVPAERPVTPIRQESSNAID